MRMTMSWWARRRTAAARPANTLGGVHTLVIDAASLCLTMMLMPHDLLLNFDFWWPQRSSR